MKLVEHAVVGAPLEHSWPLLRDVGIIAECLPGAEIHDEPGEEADEFRGALTVQFGPTRVTFNGRVRFDVIEDEHRVDISGRGQDKRGRNRASVAVVVVATQQGEAQTRLDIDGDIDIVGPLERFATTGGRHIAQELLHSFTGNIVQLIEVPEDSPATSEASPNHQDPERRALSLGQLMWRALKRWLRL